MSFVGTRPEAIKYVEMYEPEYMAYRISFGFSEELLETGISLLSHMRSSMPPAWIKTVMRYIYNSGNALEVFY